VADRLSHSEAWEILQRIIDAERESRIGQILDGVAQDDYHYIRGAVEALEYVSALPRKIVDSPETYLGRMGE